MNTGPRSRPSNERVAHVSLRGTVAAEHYTDGEKRRVIEPVADLHRTPDTPALERQLLQGAAFLVLEERQGWCFGQAAENGYVGYMRAKALGPFRAPTHLVTAARSFAFKAPDLKSPCPTPLSCGARLAVTGEMSGFAELDNGSFVPKGHLRKITEPETDPVAVAERLIATPYLWGGNSAFGIDCSGLVQIALNACGAYCPGDSDQQMVALGAPLPADTAVRRGDLLFWRGHVAWCTNETGLIHANAGAMAVAHESRNTAIQRIETQGDGPVIAQIRPDLDLLKS